MKAVLSILGTMALGLTLPVGSWAQNSSTDRIERAIAALQAGDTEKAIAEVSEAIKLTPERPDGYLLRSNLRSSVGDNAGARADISKVIELKPEMGSAYYERAILRLVDNDADGALKDLDSAILNNNKTDHVYVLRSHLRAVKGMTKEAVADLDEAIKLNPNSPQAYLSRAGLLLTLEDRALALSDLDYVLTWYETDPASRPLPKKVSEDDKAATRKAALDAGKVGKQPSPKTVTVEVAVETTNESPGDKEMVPAIAWAYLNRGLIHSYRGNAEAAIADFTRSIRVSPEQVSPLFYRATELEGKGDLDGALSDVSKAIDLEPKNGNLRVEHGVLLLLLGRSKEAEGDFAMLLEADPVLWQKRIDERIAALRQRLLNRPN